MYENFFEIFLCPVLKFKEIKSYKYRDGRDRRLRYGPNQASYNPINCQDKCKNFKYFALRDNGICTCDADLSYAKSYGQGSCGTIGGKWCNTLYENVDHKLGSVESKYTHQILS